MGATDTARMSTLATAMQLTAMQLTLMRETLTRLTITRGTLSLRTHRTRQPVEERGTWVSRCSR
jgi:hypothetical protein